MARGVKFIPWSMDRLIEQVRSVCIIDDNGCWLWNYGGTTTEWYPEITVSRKRRSVSRWILEVATGEIGEVARHKCDRERCCNPDHLLWGTQLDNVRDSFERGRRAPRRAPEPRKTSNPKGLARGSRHGRSVFTEADVLAIRERHDCGTSIYRLAKDHAVTKATIGRIVRRTTWTHI